MVRTFTELAESLDAALSPEEKRDIRALAEAELWKLHTGLNALIRSLAFHRNESASGRAYLGRLCLQPDDASAVLGVLYWRHLRGLALGRDEILSVLEREFVLGTPDELAQWAAELGADCRALAG
ncbi:MAG: hypothetical protein QM702_13065 [Rubrivivax sp.]